jgi:hypothetical protein
MHYMQTYADLDPEGSGPEDARVHCVVLKIRTEPCVADLHQDDPRRQAVRGSPAKQLLPQDPTACSPSRVFRALVRLSRKRAAYWPRLQAPAE